MVGEPVAKPLGVEPREGTGAAVGLPVTETLGIEPREAVGAVVGVPVVEMLGVEPREASGAAVREPWVVGIEPTLAHLSMSWLVCDYKLEPDSCQTLIYH